MHWNCTLPRSCCNAVAIASLCSSSICKIAFSCWTRHSVDNVRPLRNSDRIPCISCIITTHHITQVHSAANATLSDRVVNSSSRSVIYHRRVQKWQRLEWCCRDIVMVWSGLAPRHFPNKLPTIVLNKTHKCKTWHKQLLAVFNNNLVQYQWCLSENDSKNDRDHGSWNVYLYEHPPTYGARSVAPTTR